MTRPPLLQLDQLTVTVSGASGPRPLVSDCTLEVARGEALALVGESGSGKTLSVRAVAGLLSAGLNMGGAIHFDGLDFADASPQALRELRAHRIGMMFQTPRAHLNPLRTIGDFLTEALVTVARVPRAVATGRALELLDEVGITDPARRLRQRPAELSGGLLQRVMIASALAMGPELLLADEITTALDVTTQEEVMALIGRLRRERGLSLLFVTHDLALAGAVCDRVVVMQQGRTIETLPAASMRDDAREEYTRVLLSAALPERCPDVDRVSPTHTDALVQLRGLCKQYRLAGGERLTAVDDVSFTLPTGGSVGVVGESGSGKSTTARLLLGLERAEAGDIRVAGEDWSKPARGGRERRKRARLVQMVFQDPYQSLDRRQTVSQCLGEAIRIQQPRASREDVDARIALLLDQVRLDPRLLTSRPRALSGGQRQRVAIARALAAEPRALVLDEAVSALDVTTQVEILSLLDTIRRETGVAFLMITHDLTVIRRLCDEVVVMRGGQIVERGTAAQILDHPQHAYTQLLLDSIPREGWIPRQRLTERTRALPVLPTHPKGARA